MIRVNKIIAFLLYDILGYPVGEGHGDVPHQHSQHINPGTGQRYSSIFGTGCSHSLHDRDT